MEKRDEELIAEYQHGDQDALEVLFGRYKKAVFNFALRILNNRADAEDVTSDVMLILFTKSESYVNNPNAKFSTWLLTIARNACISQIRKQKRTVSLWSARNKDNEYREWDIPDTKDSPPEMLVANETTLQVKLAIRGLPLAQREAIILREYHKLNYAEISQILSCSLENVKILIFRAREELRTKLSSFMTEGNND